MNTSEKIAILESRLRVHQEFVDETEAELNALRNEIKASAPVTPAPAPAPEATVKPKDVYTPPPRYPKAEKHWPFMRCKRIAKVLLTTTKSATPLRSHHDYLSYIAKTQSVSIDTLLEVSSWAIFIPSHPLYRKVPRDLLIQRYY